MYIPVIRPEQLRLYFHVTQSRKRLGLDGVGLGISLEINVTVGGTGCDRNELVCVT